MWKWLLASLLFFVVVIELVFFAPTQGDREADQDWQENGKMSEDMKADIEQVLSGTRLIESQGQKKVWQLQAKEARKTKGSDDWRLKNVDVDFFGENSVSYNALGNNGFVGDNQKKLKMEGDIVITSSNGYVLNTEIIYYRTDSRSIEGPQPVLLKGPPDPQGGGPLYMESDLFDADLSTNIINLKKNVRGRKRMSGGRKMKIRSKEAIFSGQSNIALFKKDVVMDVDSMTITGPRAKFVYQEGFLHSLFIDGGVKIKDVGKWGVAEEAIVFFQEDKYILRGNPKVVQADDQLVGDEIIIYDGGDRVQVKKAKTKYNTKEEGEPGF